MSGQERETAFDNELCMDPVIACSSPGCEAAKAPGQSAQPFSQCCEIPFLSTLLFLPAWILELASFSSVVAAILPYLLQHQTSPFSAVCCLLCRHKRTALDLLLRGNTIVCCVSRRHFVYVRLLRLLCYSISYNSWPRGKQTTHRSFASRCRITQRRQPRQQQSVNIREKGTEEPTDEGAVEAK